MFGIPIWEWVVAWFVVDMRNKSKRRPGRLSAFETMKRAGWFVVIAGALIGSFSAIVLVIAGITTLLRY